MAHALHGEWEIGVGPEEGEGEQPSAEHRGGKAGPGAQRSGREHPSQRGDAHGHAGDDQWQAGGDGLLREAREHQAGPAGDGECRHQAARRALAAGRSESEQSRECDQARDDDQRRQAQEDPPPAGVAEHEGGETRSEEAGHDPRAGQHRQHPRTQGLGEAAADAGIGDGRHGTGAQSLHGASHHEHLHRPCLTGDEQADDEQRQPGQIRWSRAPFVGRLPGHDDADQARQHEGAEHPAVEADPAQLARQHRHGRRHSQRLRRHERDGEDEPERQGAVFR